MTNSTFLFIGLATYSVFMLYLGLKYVLRKPKFLDFILAGSSHRSLVIGLSLLASIIGGSATLGLLNRSLQQGSAVFWWLALGSLGLLLNAYFFSKKLRKLQACTLPHVAHILVGREARWLCAGVIVLSWLGIVAAQFSALLQLFTVLMGAVGLTQFAFVGVALVVIAYTVCGGQHSVIRTDGLQFFLIFVGLLIPCFYMYSSELVVSEVFSEGLGLFNDSFSRFDLVKLALLVGTTYCIGPDIFSRIFAARDGKSATQALYMAAVGLLIFATLMGLLGAWLHRYADVEAGALMALMQLSMPWWLSYIFVFALVSALLSSVDTCLMTAASIMEHDIVQGTSTVRVRYFIAIFGCVAVGIVFLQDQIIPLLLSSYAVYVPGIVCPLAVALFAYPRRSVHKKIWLSAVFIGSSCGVLASLTGNATLPFFGMGISLCLSLMAVYYGSCAELPSTMSNIPAEAMPNVSPNILPDVRVCERQAKILD